MKVLVTGGAGYIGSTISSALEEHGHTPIILDSLVTGRKEFVRSYMFYEGDISDRANLERIFREHPDIECTIHCAALIVVPDSVKRPYEYYTENVGKSLELFRNLNDLGCHKVVFSSSASLYDVVPDFVVTEDSPLNPNSPYARTKFMMEMILKDFCKAYELQAIALRYFNPIGADPKMRTGLQIASPTHILGRLVEVALGREPIFQITGVDWPTRDGTGIRDYIHVWDLAQAHVKAVTKFAEAMGSPDSDDDSYLVINLGTSNGVTVKEFVEAFETVNGAQINKEEKPARPGDVAGSYANADRAKRLLGWETELTIEDAISDALKWGKAREEVLGIS